MEVLFVIFIVVFVVLSIIETWLRGHPLVTLVLAVIIVVVLMSNGAFRTS